MKKGTFDNRGYLEIVENLKSERTRLGDHITLKIEFDGTRKPKFFLLFSSYEPDLKHLKKEEEITDFIPDSFKFEMTDDFGRELNHFTNTYVSWKEYVEIHVGPEIKGAIVAGGRNFHLDISDKGVAR